MDKTHDIDRLHHICYYHAFLEKKEINIVLSRSILDLHLDLRHLDPTLLINEVRAYNAVSLMWVVYGIIYV